MVSNTRLQNDGICTKVSFNFEEVNIGIFLEMEHQLQFANFVETHLCSDHCASSSAIFAINARLLSNISENVLMIACSETGPSSLPAPAPAALEVVVVVELIVGLLCVKKTTN